MFESRKVKLNDNFWILILIAVFLMSAFNWWKIYHLRNIYLNPDILKKSLTAINYLRVNYGLAATDLALSQINDNGFETVFKFYYEYNTPDKFLKNNSTAIISVMFDNSSVIKVDKKNE